MDVPRLLITDDDHALRAAIAEVFRKLGLDIATAGDGDEAISVIESGQVHLIVLDMHMPRVSGLEVMRHVRSHDGNLPFILMSAALDESIEREAEQMHAYRILSKPLRVTTLRETVMQGLREVYGWKAG
ncbi:MAG: response regulator [Planctomycetaceae bacterium]